MLLYRDKSDRTPEGRYGPPRTPRQVPQFTSGSRDQMHPRHLQKPLLYCRVGTAGAPPFRVDF